MFQKLLGGGPDVPLRQRFAHTHAHYGRSKCWEIEIERTTLHERYQSKLKNCHEHVLNIFTYGVHLLRCRFTTKRIPDFRWSTFQFRRKWKWRCVRPSSTSNRTVWKRKRQRLDHCKNSPNAAWPNSSKCKTSQWLSEMAAKRRSQTASFLKWSKAFSANQSTVLPDCFSAFYMRRMGWFRSEKFQNTWKQASWCDNNYWWVEKLNKILKRAPRDDANWMFTNNEKHRFYLHFYRRCLATTVFCSIQRIPSPRLSTTTRFSSYVASHIQWYSICLVFHRHTFHLDRTGMDYPLGFKWLPLHIKIACACVLQLKLKRHSADGFLHTRIILGLRRVCDYLIIELYLYA